MRSLHVTLTAIGIASALLHAAAPTARAQVCGVRFDRVLVCPDTSGSLDAQEYGAVLAALQRTLPDILIALDAREAGVLPWATALDAWRSPFSVALPRPMSAEYRSPALGEAERLFRQARLRAEARAQAEYQGTSCALREARRRAVNDAIGPLLARLARCGSGRAGCTAFSDLLARCGSEAPGTLLLVLTDGHEEACSGIPPPPPLHPSDHVEVVISLIPGESDGGGAGMIRQARLDAIRLVAPWAHVVPSFRISDTDISWLTTALAPARESSQVSTASGISGGGR